MIATLLIGAPGSDKPPYCDISIDAPKDRNWAKAKAELVNCLRKYPNGVVVNGTFCSSGYRKGMVDLLRGLGYSKVFGIVYSRNCSTDPIDLELQERLRLEPPSISEGFYRIITV